MIDHNLNIKPFSLPKRLVTLIENGVWPGDESEVEAQNTVPLVSEHVVKQVVPGEYRVYFFHPPFRSVEELCEHESDIWQEFAESDGIDLSKLVVLGDFGLGSDSILVLDYQDSNTDPKLLRLSYSHFKGQVINEVSVVSKTFDEFCRVMRLDSIGT